VSVGSASLPCSSAGPLAASLTSSEYFRMPNADERIYVAIEHAAFCTVPPLPSSSSSSCPRSSSTTPRPLQDYWRLGVQICGVPTLFHARRPRFDSTARTFAAVFAGHRSIVYGMLRRTMPQRMTTARSNLPHRCPISLDDCMHETTARATSHYCIR
jgi:hypothetical protein